MVLNKIEEDERSDTMHPHTEAETESSVDSAHSHRRSRLPAYDSISTATSTRNKTVVSFFLDEDEAEKEDGQAKKSPSGSSRSAQLSLLYAVVLVLVGVVFPVTEALRDSWLTDTAVAVFLIYLYGLSTVFLIYVQVELIRKSKETKRETKEPVESDTLSVSRSLTRPPSDMLMIRRASTIGLEGLDGVSNPAFSDDLAKCRARHAEASKPDDPASMGSWNSEQEELIDYVNLSKQTASMSHEGTSLYIRLGCLMFGIANIIYVVLELEYYQSRPYLQYCPNYQLTWVMYGHLIFILIQTFFIFKNTTISLKRLKPLQRFGLTHVIATNMCVWTRFLVREVLEGVHGHGGGSGEEHRLQAAENATVDPEEECYLQDGVVFEASLYLFPFILEYSLIATAIYVGMFSTLSLHITPDILKTVRDTLRRKQRRADAAESTVQHAHQKGHFHKAHRGLFLGFLVFTGIIIGVVLFNFTSKADIKTATLIYLICDLIVVSALLVGVLVAILKLRNFGFNTSQENTIDHVLLVVSMVGLFLLEMFSILSLVTNPEFEFANDRLVQMDFAAGVLSIVQGLLQTGFICDGMQRCARTKHQQEEMPGRGTVTFLVLCNVGSWIFKSFQVKERDLGHYEMFFGKTAWQMIMNICLPLMLFFRFHSSVCLAHIYAAAYEPEEEPPNDEHA